MDNGEFRQYVLESLINVLESLIKLAAISSILGCYLCAVCQVIKAAG